LVVAEGQPSINFRQLVVSLQALKPQKKLDSPEGKDREAKWHEGLYSTAAQNLMPPS
jgi:hypothetical protein